MGAGASSTKHLRVLIRMVFLAKSTICFLDFAIRGVLVNSQQFVVVFSAQDEGHEAEEQEQ